MTIFVRLKLEMLIRVRDFGANHAALFPPTSFAGELISSHLGVILHEQNRLSITDHAICLG